MSTRPSAAKPSHAASGPDRFRFFGKNSQMGGSRFHSAGPRDVRDGRWSDGARIVAVNGRDCSPRTQRRSRWSQVDGRWSDGSRPSTIGAKMLPSRDHGTSSTAAYPSMASVAGGWRRWQPWCHNLSFQTGHREPKAPHYASSSSSAFASFRSSVSKPSVNQP